MEQIESGIRYLDIRLDIDGDDNLQVVHGPVYCIDYRNNQKKKISSSC